MKLFCSYALSNISFGFNYFHQFLRYLFFPKTFFAVINFSIYGKNTLHLPTGQGVVVVVVLVVVVEVVVGVVVVVVDVDVVVGVVVVDVDGLVDGVEGVVLSVVGGSA